MPTRSQRHKREHAADGLDSDGWDASVFQEDTTLPYTATHPDGPTGVNGKVVNQDNGDAVASRAVTFTSSDAAVMTVDASDTTDANGQFTVQVTTVAAGSAEVRVAWANQKELGRMPVVVS